MHRSELTEREKKVARRNAILFCGAATVVMTALVIASIAYLNSAM
jgi:hypothetical protein